MSSKSAEGGAEESPIAKGRSFCSSTKSTGSRGRGHPGGDGCREPAEAHAGSRRTPLYWCDDPGRVPQVIEKDAALERRFQQCFVDQPTVADTISILRGLKDRYETHHKRQNFRQCPGGSGNPIHPLHQRSLLAGQGHRPGGRSRRQAEDGSHLQAGRTG